MSRITKARGKIARRLGVNIFEMPKYDRLLQRKSNPPGRSAPKRGRISNYGLQLLEKQKLRYAYGISERQMHGVYTAARKKPGRTGENMIELLERRLDNVVFRLGYARSRSQARQFVNHGHILVNGKKETIPSRLVGRGDSIEVREKRNSRRLARENASENRRREYRWIEGDPDKLQASVTSLPSIGDISLKVDVQRIVEYYAR